MDEIRFLERQFGGWWCGVKFGPEAGGTYRSVEGPMPFCQAVMESRKDPLVLTRESMGCPGGSRSLGWADDDEALAQAMAGKTDMDLETARAIIRRTPRLNAGIGQVVVGTRETPDVIISYAQPEAAMKLVREWQRLYGNLLPLETSGFMSVCGMVAVRAYRTGKLCLSFGCPDSRRHSGIGRDRLVVGLTRQQASGLLHNARPEHIRQSAPLPPGALA